MSRPRCCSPCVRLRPGRVCTVLFLALVPSAAAAQQAAFTQALSELTAAIDGTYGDEGALVRPAIDRMSEFRLTMYVPESSCCANPTRKVRA